MKRKKIISYFLIFLICFTACVSSLQITNAAVSYSKITDSTNIDSKYSFSPRFISGITKAEGFGGLLGSKSSDNWKAIWDAKQKKYIYEKQPDYWYYVRLTSNSQKGKVGMWYRNVGEYKGKKVDLKITIVDWKALKDPITVTTNKGKKKSYPTIAFNTDIIKINPTGGYVKAPTYRFSYYDQNGNPLAISGHTNFIDIDDEQYMESSQFVKGYLASNTKLTVKGNRVSEMNAFESNNSDKRTWCTAIFDNKSSYDVRFSSWKQDSEGYPIDKSRKNRGFYTMIVNGDTLAPFTTPVPIKEATQIAHKGETVNYTIKFTVPRQPNDFLYSTFQIKDVLPKGLKYNSFSVMDDEGNNVTSKFSESLSGRTFTASVKNPRESSFYYKSYKININCIVDDNYDFSIGRTNGFVSLSNTASIISKAGSRLEISKNSNEVNTEIRFKILTETDGNGTITANIDNIPGGENRTISYKAKAGYEVDKITVDGKDIAVDDSNKNSFSFNKIYDNHKIRVTFKPIANNKIIVHKRIKEYDFNKAYGKMITLFKCEGVDLNNVKHVYYMAVQLTEEDLSNGYYKKKVTFENIISGKYVVSEIDTSRYSFEKVTEIRGSNAKGASLECDLINNRISEGEFTNKLSNYINFSHNDLVINSFK